MPLFRRALRADGSPDAFWAWWAESGRELLSAAVARGQAAGTVAELGDAVAAVHPDLSWEVAPGDLSAHVLVVTAAGNPDLRAAARRSWVWSPVAPRCSAPT